MLGYFTSSNSPQQNVVLAQRPPITSTITSLPAPLLDSLLPHLSTLASVYHKPPSAFLGRGRASALQEAAIEEAAENARENPIAAAAAATMAGASGSAVQNNAENLLDIDFDGSAPASMQKQPAGGASGLEGLAGTPMRVASPSSGAGPSMGGGMEDLMGIFGNESGGGAGANGSGQDDLMNGFAGLDMGAGSQPPPPQTQLDNGGGGGKKTNEDLLGLF